MKLRKSQIIRLILAVCCLIAFLMLNDLNQKIMYIQPAQYAAERWQNESKSAQISVFFHQEADFTTDRIKNLHESIDERLTSQSLKAENDQARLWYDAYSTQAGQAEVTGNRKSTVKALVTVVGGDFFLLHNSRLIKGGYFTEQDLMHDRVVIDTQLAWQLFGSTDVVGMEVHIQNASCLIAGVIQPESDYASEAAYGTVPRIYLSYDFYQKHWEENTEHISCYEAVLPNPVKGFARGLIAEFVGEEDDTHVILQNTGRYTLSERWDTLRHIRNLMICETVTYPYWENAARIISFDTAMILLLQIMISIYPVIYLICLICRGYCLIDRKINQKRSAWKNRYRSGAEQV